MDNITIKEVPFGIACRIGNTIYIHKDMKSWDINLYNAIIKHEKNHSEDFSVQDVYLDISNQEISNFKKKYYSFILAHPSSLSEFVPIWKYDGRYEVNPALLILYTIIITLGVMIWSLT